MQPEFNLCTESKHEQVKCPSVPDVGRLKIVPVIYKPSPFTFSDGSTGILVVDNFLSNWPQTGFIAQLK